MTTHLKYPEVHQRLASLIGTEQPYGWASRVGISKGAFTRIWKEGTMPGPELLQRITEATGVSIDWLLTGRGQPYVIEPFDAHPHTLHQQDLPCSCVDEVEGDFASIPLYRLHAGAGHGASVGREEFADIIAFKCEWIRRELQCTPEDLYLLYVEGESMEPVLRTRDMVLVDRRDAEQVPQDGIYVVRINGTLLVKRIQRLTGGRIRLTSENPAYEPFIAHPGDPGENLNIIGRAVWMGRRL